MGLGFRVLQEASFKLGLRLRRLQAQTSGAWVTKLCINKGILQKTYKSKTIPRNPLLYFVAVAVQRLQESCATSTRIRSLAIVLMFRSTSLLGSRRFRTNSILVKLQPRSGPTLGPRVASSLEAVHSYGCGHNAVCRTHSSGPKALQPRALPRLAQKGSGCAKGRAFQLRYQFGYWCTTRFFRCEAAIAKITNTRVFGN